MTYEYNCPKCDHTFDVIKAARDMEVNEYCTRCDSPAIRNFVPSRVYFSKTSVQNAEYNPALGKVTKNAYHRTELAKRMGLVEVGNDYKSGEKMQKEFDSARETKLKKRWDDA
jgi:putative FmdB family regulatory protein